ncbi:hypothetical protein [Azonexus sp.]|uniref:hypothetical protein n=1 Tax=Azonexus sp. TaxID=1872668 RepID=UPI0027B92159|nr:hypothetical protein [Azonexus sp.]
MKKTLLLSSLLICTPGYCEAPGRLFFTPAERLSIDQGAPAADTQAHYRLDGTVKSSNGQPIYWLNGQTGNQPNPTLAVGDSSDAPLLPANSIRTHRNAASR